jgi:DNA-binding MarR family transcriptional regulator/catechol 2,3-dioxygenase-like lactoylglutathione lyase family enzyme
MDDSGAREFATPTLMRAARGAYARSIRVQLQAIGVDDLPRNGAFILTGIDAADGSRPGLTAALGVTKQAVSQLTDTLVSRGYLERSPDPGDRRRVALELTERGRLVVEAVARGVAAVDLQLRERVPAEQVDAMRAALRVLAEIKTASEAAGTGPRRADRRQLRSFSPIFPVRDLAAALAHYSALGFTTRAHEGGGEYGFADRDGTGLHLAADAGHDPGRGSAAYLYVRDADALHAEWRRPGIGGHTHPAGPTPYGLREGSHVDPDGNLIRFGSPADSPAEE